MERLFVLKTLSRTQRATKVKKFVGFSLKPLRCRDPALPPLYGHAYSRPFFHAYFSCTRMRISQHAHDTPPRVQHFSAFHFYCIHVTLFIFAVCMTLLICITSYNYCAVTSYNYCVVTSYNYCAVTSYNYCAVIKYCTPEFINLVHQRAERQRRPQACSMAVQHFHLHSTSNDSGEYLGKARKTAFFSSNISCFSNAGKSLVPLGVHTATRDSPKKASLASNCVRVLGLQDLALLVFMT